MGANALLLSGDPLVLSVLHDAFLEVRIETEMVTEASASIRLLRERKFEAVVVDLELAGANAVLENMNLHPSNRSAVVFAIVSETNAGSRWPPHAKFILSKPVSVEHAGRVVRAAFSLLMNEYRRYFRSPLEVPIGLAQEGRQFRAITKNISIGGLAVRTLQAVALGERFQLEFELPSTGKVQPSGEVVWADTQGLMGMRFVNLPDLTGSRLQSWLETRMREAR